jgi:hypothetical protein
MPHHIGRFQTGSFYSDQYITEVYFIDGQALTPSAFAETNNLTGQYIPKKYTGTYGTNGFYLPFTDNSSVLNLGRNYQPLTADPFWNRTVLLLNGTGTNNAQNNTFIDSSTNAFAITRNGNTTQGRFSPFTQGGWSNYFDGTANGSLRTDSSTDTNLSGDFTIQAWVYPTASGQSNNSEIISRGAATTLNGWHFGLIASTTQLFFGINYASSGNTSTNTQSSTNIPLNQWTHVAVTRSGNTCIIYINGVVDTTNTGFTGTPTVSGTEYVYVGRASYDTTTRQFTGYINNASIIKDTALTTFSQTTPLATGTSGQALLTCTANRFIDTNTATTAKILTVGSGASVAAFSPFTPTTAYSAATHGGSAYFDGTGDYLSITNNSSLAFGTNDFTVEFWSYLTAAKSPGSGMGFIHGTSGSANFGMSTDFINIYAFTVGGAGVSFAYVPQVNRWTHYAFVRSSGSARLYVDGVQIGSAQSYTTNITGLTGSTIIGAETGPTNYYTGHLTGLRYVNGTAVYTAAFTPPTAPVTAIANTQLLLNFVNAGIVDATGDNNIETVGDAKISTAQSKWAGSSMLFDGTDDTLTIADSPVLELGTGDFTIEAWIYPTLITGSNRAIFGHGTDGNNWWGFFLQPTGVLEFGAVSGGSVFVNRISSNSISLNTWTHVAVTRNGSTFKLWIGGSEPPSYTGSPATTSSAITDWSSPFWVGGPRWSGNTTSQFVGYLQDVRVTRAARYTGTFTPPTAQFAYNQGDINYNQWVPTNFSVTAGAGNDSLLDVPTNWGVDTGLGGEVRGNYCTWNSIHSTNASTANGNLETTLTANASLSAQIRGSMANLSGKWYWESVVTADGNQSHWIGVIGASSRYDIRLDNSNTLNQVLYARYDGQKIVNGTISAYGASYIVGDVIGIALDLDIGIVTFYKNNVSQGAISLPTTGIAYTPVFWYSTTATSGTIASNFGQRPFAYAAPAGFKSLNTHNLPALAVTKSNTAFDTVLYTGTGTARTITGFNFGPDLVWVKQRSGASTAHSLQDIVRGADKHLTSNGTDIEVNSAAYGGGVTSFTGNGFSTGTWGAVNENTQTYVAWAWDAGTTTVVNTAGSITANVRVNSTSGFSIVSWIGTGANATVGHGLNAVPRFIIVRNRDTVYNWRVWHTALSGTQLLYLNTTDATVTEATMWNSTIPTSTVFSLGTNGGVNESTKNIIAYCFAAVPGFSAFGSYTGNSSTDGPFVHTGFRPAFVIWKRTDTAGNNWTMQDYKRSNPYNPADGELMPSSSAAESTSFSKVDLLSNGFKLRSTNAGENASNGTYIYAAFAESPFKYARAR